MEIGLQNHQKKYGLGFKNPEVFYNNSINWPLCFTLTDKNECKLEPYENNEPDQKFWLVDSFYIASSILQEPCIELSVSSFANPYFNINVEELQVLEVTPFIHEPEGNISYKIVPTNSR